MDRALMGKRWEALRDLMHELDREFELDLEHRFQSRVDVDDIIRAILYPGDREPLIKRLPTRDRYTLGGLMSTAIRRARELDPSILEYLQNEIPIVLRKNQNYVNPPAGGQDANSAAPVDLAAIPTSNAAAQVRRNWADITEEVNPGAEEGFTLAQGRKRRRGSGNSPTTAAPSSNAGASRTIRRPQSSAGSVPRAQEIRATRAHIADARARQASSSEEHCVYIEHSPELEPFHYLRALDRKLGGTAGVIQITKANGHQLLGLTNRGLAERLISEGLEVEGTLLRAFPFRKRAERITVGNLPFFVADSAVITALSPFGRVTSIAPKQMKAGPYVYVDGRRDVFINGLHQWRQWPHQPLLLASHHRPPLHRLSAAPALPMEETPSAPPPVIPAPSLQAPEGSVGPRSATSQHPEPPPARPDFVAQRDPLPAQKTLGPAAPTPNVEMSIVEETSASSTSLAKNATRVDLDAFIERHPSVSFAGTDALGLGREEVLDLLSSRTKAQRKGPLLSPPQCDALAGLIGQILDLRPGAARNLYKVLGQVKAELRPTPAAVPTPPPPAPRPAEPTSPALHGERTSPDIATPPPPLSTQFIDACYDQANDIIYALSRERFSEPLSNIGVTEGDIVEAIIFPEDREPLLRRLSTQNQDANSAAPVDLAAIPTSDAAAQVRRNWADITEEVNPGAEEGFTLVQGRKRRRGSGNSPTTAAPSSNAHSRPIRRPQSSAGSVPRAQEIRATRAHIADARARQASSSEEHCVYIEHSPELEPFHYLRALDRKLGGTAGVIQITKVNGHQLLGLTNRGLAERLISEGLEVEGTLLRAFPFRKRAERITVGNLPFFVADSAVITALSPFGRVTSIAPKQMKAGPYVYVDGRRDVFITLHEGITIERLPTRLDINIKGQAWPAYLSSGIRCSRCHGQGHRRAICPLLAGLANNTRTAPLTTPAGVPPPTTPAPPQRSAAQPPAPTPSNPAMEVCSAPPVARAALHSSAPRPSPPAAPAFPMEETPPAPPPVTPAPSLQTPGSREPAAPTPDVEMSFVEETFGSSTSSAKNATRVDLDAFIEGLPSVSFAKTDALGLGREEVLDLLSSRTKAQRKGPLLSPPQCDALVGLIGQILDLKPGHTSNLYKVLGQVRAELTKTPAAAPTPPLPAPRPSGPTPPTPHSEELMPAVMTPPPPALEDNPDLAQWEMSLPLYQIFMKEPDLGPTKNGNEKIISKENSENRVYANPPTGVRNANLAAARGDVTTGSAAATSSNGAARVLGSWADSIEDQGPGEDDDFTVVKNKKRRRESPGSPAAAAPSSGTRGAGATRRPRSSTGWAPRAEEIRTTRANIVEARARQASSTEDHCVYVERSPELEPFYYMRAIERMFGGTREVFQLTKMNGHFLVGLANRGMAERLVNEGLEVEGTLHRAFPFRKRAERITVGNLPFFVGDAAVISALSSFGRVTSLAPKLMKAGPYIYNDGRREAFIILREGMTIERLPTRLDITIKGEAWPAYLSSGIRCSRCRGQGHRRANCPLLARRTTAPGPATPTSPTSVPPATAPRLPQQPSAQPPPPASPSPTMEVSDVPPTSRAALHPPEALRQSPPAPSALPAEDAPPAPPPVTPAPSLRTPGSREPAAPTPDVEMSIVEETFASSTSSAKNATRVDLDAFIEGLPSVSFAKTDALGLGREEVLDLLSSRTKAQRKGPLLSPPQCDALVGLIGQILDLKPGHTSNLYKVLGQVKAELRTTPAVPPTPTLPAPRPDGPIPPPPHGDTTTPDMATSPSPLSTQMDRALMDKRWEALRDLMHQLDLEFELDLEHRFESRVDEDDIIRAILYPGDREPLIKRLPTRDRYTLGGLMSTAIRRARELDPSILEYDNKKLFNCQLSHVYTRPCGHASRELPSFSPLASGITSRMATNLARAESPSKAEDKPVRLGSKAQPSAEITAKDVLQNKNPIVLTKNQNYVNPSAGSQDANSAAPVDLAAIPTSDAAAQVRRNWADITEEVNPGAEEGFTLVQGRKRRRGSANSPTAAAPSSNPGGSRTIRRPQPSAGSVPRAQEIRVTRAHIAEARARQASSSEEHCVYIEHSPELEPFHYLRALDRMLGGTAGVIQITKVNGHQLLGLTNRGLAERLISEGLEVEGTLLRAFPFRKRAERITVGNLPFFVADSAVITALSPYGRVTSIAPKQMKAGPYVYVDGRRDVFITLHEGITIERLPTRLDINIKGQAWPAYLSSGIRCSRCHGQGHRRAICPLLAGLANNTRTAPPTTPAGVPPPTTPAPPQRSAAQPPAPTPSNPAMEVCSAPPVARAALHSSAPRPSPPAAPAFPMEETPPAPPPVTPAPSLQTPGSREPAAPTPDVEMSIVEETFASSTSSAKNATRVDLDAFIEGLPSVSFAKTDALGLGREEVLDLLSSRTKAQRKGPLLSPPQCDALVGLIGQILDLKPGHTSNLYKVLGQVKAELRTTPAVPPTPPLPAPRPSGPTPPTSHSEELMPAVMTPPPPALEDDPDLTQWQMSLSLFQIFMKEPDLGPTSESGIDQSELTDATLNPRDREELIEQLLPRQRNILAQILDALLERALDLDPFLRGKLSELRASLPP
ncbi:hypothetical protein LAZ67_1002157 [Cordylochernes scorpioides]|uniref:CCHC-type domain-containing protein n=1 Tax=Cordylochernes scorpioides TaxID=51811 RepID=A0ABY6JWQ9_9ARAC|nr:hypothetical protein LAZ67_1002157 [Cordylochernes scorpioides]